MGRFNTGTRAVERVLDFYCARMAVMTKRCEFGACNNCGFCQRKDTIERQARKAAAVTGNPTIDGINYRAELAKAGLSYINKKAAEHERENKKARRKSNGNLRTNRHLSKVQNMGQ